MFKHEHISERLYNCVPKRIAILKKSSNNWIWNKNDTNRQTDHLWS